MNDEIIYKSLRLWVTLVCIFSVLFCAYWLCNYETYPVAYYDSNRLNFLRHNTPSYPPPLASFMDPPDVFNEKYVTIKSLF